jgi:dUTP pyrophosphatase
MWISAPSSTATPIATRYHHNGTDNRSSNRELPDVDREAGTGLSLTEPRVASLVVSGSVDAPPHEPSAACPPVDGVRPTVDVLLTRLDADLPVPTYARPGDAGADLHAVCDVVLEPGERALVGTGVAIALPTGYAGFVHPRSGLAARCGLSIVNAPGTIDAGYRGELLVCLVNLDPRTPVRISRGDRIAQLVVQRVEHARFVEVEQLPAAERGTSGYGSTGGHRHHEEAS